MTCFPEFLYKLTPRDEQVTPLELFKTNLTFTAAAAQEIASFDTYTVPAGKILVLQSVSFEFIAGAAQTGDYGVLQLSYNNYVTLPYARATRAGAALYNYNGGELPIFVPAGTIVSGYLGFSAGAAANDGSISLDGVLIPRGNFAV